ncbi:hypothetical protein RRF57_013387 [Xylaria bambusicola]|uniref:Clr5 domain-containing protein n=1 Tax=Xylaria bambusicola TaxID=326684 RepID=A0AAN7ZBE8_9PEZI
MVNVPIHRVIFFMREEHNFSKTKSQYAYQLKKWGAKKNLKRTDWQHLRSQLQERPGKQSEVVYRGIPLPLRKIRKETQRYAFIPTAREFGARVPYEVVLRARTPPVVDNSSWPDLPWFRFKDRVLPSEL